MAVIRHTGEKRNKTGAVLTAPVLSSDSVILEYSAGQQAATEAAEVMAESWAVASWFSRAMVPKISSREVSGFRMHIRRTFFTAELGGEYLGIPAFTDALGNALIQGIQLLL